MVVHERRVMQEVVLLFHRQVHAAADAVASMQERGSARGLVYGVSPSEAFCRR
jgi:hypothetical protein